MKIWIHINGVQEGPYEESNLPLDRMNASTPVWYEGLSYWMPAAKAPVTAQIITNHLMQTAKPDSINEEQRQAPETSINTEYSAPHNQFANTAATQQPYNRNPQQAEPKPATYLIWSIILTVLCCNPIGIIPIITGNQVTSKYNNYNYSGARKSSEITEWWLMITIVTSLMLAPLNMLIIL